MLFSQRITNEHNCRKPAFRKESIMWVLSKNISSAREVLTCFYIASTAFFSTLNAFEVSQSKQECLKQASYAHIFPKNSKPNQNQKQELLAAGRRKGRGKITAKSMLQADQWLVTGERELWPSLKVLPPLVRLSDDLLKVTCWGRSSSAVGEMQSLLRQGGNVDKAFTQEIILVFVQDIFGVW